ncbi:probable RNA-binding protein 19 [Paramormyrops kingsleyae]|uniref:Probable RNA-binding protein 19 n=1 Tax=Paramormyrops kingsleyae TaxID=1676925 RepID=A0A3B3TBA1_9TELE|nr:probable RNA-binding protein 19 [Paramormyrops kingsleyae]
MSRLIVKNLPNGMKEERFRGLFAAFGSLTDCSLKFTKEGKFRKFGFVGFKSEEEAERALKHFNKSFVDTSRVTVEWCKSFGDPTKARAWSKHTHPPPANNKEHEEKQKNKKKKKQEIVTVVGELEQDQGFQEFLAVHQKRAQGPTWTNDSLPKLADTSTASQEKKISKAAKDDYLNFDSSESDLSQDEDQEDEAIQNSATDALKTGLSDMEYLRSKVATVHEDELERDDGDVGGSAVSHCTDSAYESGNRDTVHTHKEKGRHGKMDIKQMKPATDFTVKLRGAPFNVKEQQVREFMTPLKPVAIRIVRNSKGDMTGYVYVDLRSQEEVTKALLKNKDYMGGRYIEVFCTSSSKKESRPGTMHAQQRNFQRELREDEEEEDVSESGRLFIRNLPYTCTEQELSDIFTKYGPLSEIHFPIDSLTKKPKGFAFVTYMIPEDAVHALAEMDGHVFQGRMLHIMPSTMKKENQNSGPLGPGSSSYKNQRDAKQKAASSSSHNWNTLFLGTSAVADVIAEKYNTSKSQVLNHESQGSLAVRMALGETQIVQETRQFLLENQICLDSFSQASGSRSNTVLLVKNLPAGVQAAELEALFSPHGSLGRVLLPPSGLTAIVEFLEPTEAKKAFTRLAYTKFQHVPLYLEWAPMGVFSAPPPDRAERPSAETDPVPPSQDQSLSQEESSEDEEESLPGCTLFIKNLNFHTKEETLAEVFSKCGPVRSCTISKKKDKTGVLLSMGYGFVEYKTPKAAQKALRQLQHCMVDEHQLELKLSERVNRSVPPSSQKKQAAKKQTSSKILVRNIPFQATAKELRELFGTFGELKTVRLPKKMSGTGSHRGFGFVDFLTKQDAKKAFTTLCHSTHLYGRRLVLEWADTEETLEALRRKTAQHFHDMPKKMKKSEVMTGVLESLEGEEEASE